MGGVGLLQMLQMLWYNIAVVVRHFCKAVTGTFNFASLFAIVEIGTLENKK